MVGPEAFTEVRYLAHHKQLRALGLHPASSPPSSSSSSAATPAACIRTYRTEDAETIVVALGSVNGTVAGGRRRDARARLAHRLACRSAPSGPSRSRRCARRCSDAKRVVVLEKCLAVGLGGIVSDGVRKSLSGIQLNGYTVIAGLGGRAITRASLTRLFEDARARRARAGDVPRPERRRGRATSWSARASTRRSGPDGRGDPAAHRHGRLGHRLNRERRVERADHQVLPDRHLHRRQPPARARTSARCRPTCSAPTRSTRGTAPARAAARRSARATRSTRRCARPTTS